MALPAFIGNGRNFSLEKDCYSCVLSTLQRSVFFVDPGRPLGFMISQQEILDSGEAAKMSEMSTWRGLGEARV